MVDKLPSLDTQMGGRGELDRPETWEPFVIMVDVNESQQRRGNGRVTRALPSVFPLVSLGCRKLFSLLLTVGRFI